MSNQRRLEAYQQPQPDQAVFQLITPKEVLTRTPQGQYEVIQLIFRGLEDRFGISIHSFGMFVHGILRNIQLEQLAQLSAADYTDSSELTAEAEQRIQEGVTNATITADRLVEVLRFQHNQRRTSDSPAFPTETDPNFQIMYGYMALVAAIITARCQEFTEETRSLLVDGYNLFLMEQLVISVWEAINLGDEAVARSIVQENCDQASWHRWAVASINNSVGVTDQALYTALLIIRTISDSELPEKTTQSIKVIAHDHENELVRSMAESVLKQFAPKT